MFPTTNILHDRMVNIGQVFQSYAFEDKLFQMLIARNASKSIFGRNVLPLICAHDFETEISPLALVPTERNFHIKTKLQRKASANPFEEKYLASLISTIFMFPAMGYPEYNIFMEELDITDDRRYYIFYKCEMSKKIRALRVQPHYRRLPDFKVLPLMRNHRSDNIKAGDVLIHPGVSKK